MFRRGTRIVVLAVAAAIVLPGSALAATKVVYAGGPVNWARSLQREGAGVNNFLINRVTIHVGDSVTWNGASLSNGFHTVDIPALAGSDMPLIVDSGRRVGNNVKDAAGNPFWFDGKLDYLGFNPALFGPSGGNTYDGTSRIDSGLPFSPKPRDFTVKFTTPGQFNYFCDVHYGMGGQVVVLPPGAPIPSSKQDAATLTSEERHYTAEAKQVDQTKPRGNSVSVGASGPGGLEVYGMFPRILRITAGTTVTFFMSKHTRETHTASFGPAGYLGRLAKGFNGNPIDPRSVYASSPYGQVIPLSNAAHGNGFGNTGAMDRDSSTPVPAANRIRFNTPGVYQYMCLIHTFMHGTVIVSAAAARARPPSSTSPAFTG